MPFVRGIRKSTFAVGTEEAVVIKSFEILNIRCLKQVDPELDC